MRVVINAISVREGGPLVVLHELLSRMSALRREWAWQVVINSQVRSPLPELPNVVYQSFPEVDRCGWRTRLWYETSLSVLLRSVGADLLFSQTNYLPVRRMPCRTLLLVQHAGHFSPLFRRLTEKGLSPMGRLAWRLKGRWVRSSVRRADAVTVQTKALAQRIVQDTDCRPAHIRVIAHGSGQVKVPNGPVTPPAEGERLRIGYITKHGVQKNFAVLFTAIARLRERGIESTVVLSLSEALPENRDVLALAEAQGVADLIENHGERSTEDIAALYRSLHVFVFPSLCESFGFPMVEAMAYGLPLLVADTESNVEVAGFGGEAFPSKDPDALSNALGRLHGDRAWFAARVAASLERAAQFGWQDAAGQILSLMEQMVGSTLSTSRRV